MPAELRARTPGGQGGTLRRFLVTLEKAAGTTAGGEGEEEEGGGARDGETARKPRRKCTPQRAVILMAPGQQGGRGRKRESGADPAAAAAWLTRTREMRGLSMNELAKKAGTSHNTVSSIEGRKSPFSRDMIKRLADALGFPAEEALRICFPRLGAENTLPLPPGAQVVKPRPGVTIILDPSYFVETDGPDAEADRALVIRATEEMESFGHATGRRDDLKETGHTARDDAQPQDDLPGLRVREGGGG